MLGAVTAGQVGGLSAQTAHLAHGQRAILVEHLDAGLVAGEVLNICLVAGLGEHTGRAVDTNDSALTQVADIDLGAIATGGKLQVGGHTGDLGGAGQIQGSLDAVTCGAVVDGHAAVHGAAGDVRLTVENINVAVAALTAGDRAAGEVQLALHIDIAAVLGAAAGNGAAGHIQRTQHADAAALGSACLTADDLAVCKAHVAVFGNGHSRAVAGALGCALDHAALHVEGGAGVDKHRTAAVIVYTLAGRCVQRAGQQVQLRAGTHQDNAAQVGLFADILDHTAADGIGDGEAGVGIVDRISASEIAGDRLTVQIQHHLLIFSHIALVAHGHRPS